MGAYQGQMVNEEEEDQANKCDFTFITGASTFHEARLDNPRPRENLSSKSFTQRFVS